MPLHKRTLTRCSRPTSVLLALALTGGGLAALGAAPAAAAPSDNDLFYGLTTSDEIVTFRSQSSAILSTANISGLAAGDDVIGIDERPLTGELFAVARDTGSGVGSLYVVNPVTGAATEVGTNTTAAITGTTFGVDFNPNSDQLRVVGSDGKNYSVDPDTGVFTLQTAVTGAADLAGAAYSNNVHGAASTTLYAIDVDANQLYKTGAPSGGVFNALPGNLTAPTPPDAGSTAGFDIAADGTAYAVLTVSGQRGLYEVNETTGTASQIGIFTLPNVADITRATSRVGFPDTDSAAGFQLAITVDEDAGTATVTATRTGDTAQVAMVDYALGGGSAMTPQDYTLTNGTLTFGVGASTASFNVAINSDTIIEGDENFGVFLTNPVGAVLRNAVRVVTIDDGDDDANLIGLTGSGANQRLQRISVATGNVGAGQVITGLDTNDELVGIDFRPATGQIIGVAKDSVNGLGYLYSIDPVTGVATGPVALTDASTSAPLGLTGSSFAVDINPTSDAVRIIGNDDQNLRANPTTGSTTVDGDINPSGAQIVGAAYTNSVAGASSTELFGIDVVGDELLEISPPNDGTLTAPVPLGVAAAGNVGFDIDGSSGIGYASFNDDLYTVDEDATASPAAVIVLGTTNNLPNVEDITVVNAPAAPASTFTVADATVAEGGTATITVTRSGSSAAGATVGYATSNGTAAAGSDYTATSGTLSFAAGDSTATFTVATTEDAVAESSETVTLTLSAPSGGGAVGGPGTLTITDNDAAAIDTSLTINASPFVRWPTTPVITGVLRNASTGAPLPGRTVYVIYKQQSVSGLAAFRPVLKLTTNAQGVYRGAIRPTVNAVWRALYLGSATEQVAGSKYDVTKMQITNPTVNGFGSTLTVRSGTQINVSGTVLPGNVRHPVVLQWIRPDGIFNLNGLSRANAAGNYVSSRVFDRRGTYRLRILGVNTDNNVHSASRTFVLRVV